jgi:hypothetical protein
MRQTFQVADLSENLVGRKEIWRAADLYLGAHVDSTDRASEDDPIYRIITSVCPTAGVGAYCLDRNALVFGIDDMFSFRYTTDQEPPLRMKETRLEGKIFPMRGQV